MKYLEKERACGCVGQAEKDWIGAEQCPTYQKYNNKSGLEICKEILGKQERIKL